MYKVLNIVLTSCYPCLGTTIGATLFKWKDFTNLDFNFNNSFFLRFVETLFTSSFIGVARETRSISIWKSILVAVAGRRIDEGGEDKKGRVGNTKFALYSGSCSILLEIPIDLAWFFWSCQFSSSTFFGRRLATRELKLLKRLKTIVAYVER